MQVKGAAQTVGPLDYTLARNTEVQLYKHVRISVTTALSPLRLRRARRVGCGGRLSGRRLRGRWFGGRRLSSRWLSSRRLSRGWLGRRGSSAALTREGPSNVSRNRTLLNIDAGPEEVEGGVVRATVRETEHTNVEVGRVRRRGAAHAGHDLLQGGTARGGPETNPVGGEVDVVREVVPGVSSELRAPLRHTANHPPEGVVAGAAGS